MGSGRVGGWVNVSGVRVSRWAKRERTRAKRVRVGVGGRGRWRQLLAQEGEERPSQSTGADSHLPQFNARGMVAMANSGPDTNKCVLPPPPPFPPRMLTSHPCPDPNSSSPVRPRFLPHPNPPAILTHPPPPPPPPADAKQPHLDTKYSIFGRVIDGFDTTLDSMVRRIPPSLPFPSSFLPPPNPER